MSFALAESAIRQQLISGWVDANGAPLTPIAWENIALDPAHPTIGPVGGPWLLCEVAFGGATQVALGLPGAIVWRATGMILLHCFVPGGSGKAAATAFADTAAAIFRGQSFAGLVCRAAHPEPAEASGSWFRVTVSVPFQFDDIG